MLLGSTRSVVLAASAELLRVNGTVADTSGAPRPTLAGDVREPGPDGVRYRTTSNAGGTDRVPRVSTG